MVIAEMLSMVHNQRCQIMEPMFLSLKILFVNFCARELIDNLLWIYRGVKSYRYVYDGHDRSPRFVSHPRTHHKGSPHNGLRGSVAEGDKCNGYAEIELKTSIHQTQIYLPAGLKYWWGTKGIFATVVGYSLPRTSTAIFLPRSE
jgi:hypothetical protein